MYVTLISITHLFQIIRSKSYETCPYCEQINEQIMSLCYVGQYASIWTKSRICLSRGNYTAYDRVYCDTQLLIIRFSFPHYT